MYECMNIMCAMCAYCVSSVYLMCDYHVIIA